jgi:hypothetical protein
MLFYFYVMLPLASLRVLWQEMFRPVFWEKTAHPGRGVRGFVTEPPQPQVQEEETFGMVDTEMRGALSPALALLLWGAVLALDLLFIAILLADPTILSSILAKPS